MLGSLFGECMKLLVVQNSTAFDTTRAPSLFAVDAQETKGQGVIFGSGTVGSSSCCATQSGRTETLARETYVCFFPALWV